MQLMHMNQWSDTSGKIVNPGKQYFLRLAVRCIQDINRERDREGLTYARKAMIRTGMALNINGLWEEKQLYPKLQEIIRRHRRHFNGEAVVVDAADEAEIETRAEKQPEDKAEVEVETETEAETEVETGSEEWSDPL